MVVSSSAVALAARQRRPNLCRDLALAALKPLHIGRGDVSSPPASGPPPAAAANPQPPVRPPASGTMASGPASPISPMPPLIGKRGRTLHDPAPSERHHRPCEIAPPFWKRQDAADQPVDPLARTRPQRVLNRPHRGAVEPLSTMLRATVRSASDSRIPSKTTRLRAANPRADRPTHALTSRPGIKNTSASHTTAVTALERGGMMPRRPAASSSAILRIERRHPFIQLRHHPPPFWVMIGKPGWPAGLQVTSASPIRGHIRAASSRASSAISQRQPPEGIGPSAAAPLHPARSAPQSKAARTHSGTRKRRAGAALATRAASAGALDLGRHTDRAGSPASRRRAQARTRHQQ